MSLLRLLVAVFPIAKGLENAESIFEKISFLPPSLPKLDFSLSRIPIIISRIIYLLMTYLKKKKK
jgi:hypothetical protein